MSRIVTFYSYKGGVGRSMALANIALLLAQRGHSVLAVDWDLEAPGLENYFGEIRAPASGMGLLSLLKRMGKASEYRSHLTQIGLGQSNLQLLASGRTSDPDYSVSLQDLNWIELFRRGGGEFIEQLRERWRADFDITLIDSRTGLSDAGGVCTIQLPDIVVGMFTANHQSLYGVRDVMRLVQSARQSLSYDRSQLNVVPLGSRFGNDFRESRVWLDRATEAMGELCRDWLPKWADPREVIDQLKIPHVDYFGYGEKLAVLEQSAADPQGMSFVYEKVARLLESDLRQPESILHLTRTSSGAVASETEHRELTARTYDIYVSYLRTGVIDEWVRHFMDVLQLRVSQMLGREISVFLDFRVIESGDRWSERLSDALERSEIMIAFVSSGYFSSKASLAEWSAFVEREKADVSSTPLIVPILLDRTIEGRSHLLLDRLTLDLSEEFFARTYSFSPDSPIVDSLSNAIAHSLVRAAGLRADSRGATERRDIIARTVANSRPVGSRAPGVLPLAVTESSLKQYSAWKYPAKTRSARLEAAIVRDLDHKRFASLHALDAAVESAKIAVEAYEKERPDLFKFSADYITKSLGFADKAFRVRHRFSKETMLAFKKYGHLVSSDPSSFADVSLVRVTGLVSRVRDDGARVRVPRGIYQMRQLGHSTYELSGDGLPRFELTLQEVASYMGSEMSLIDGEWP